MLGGGLQGSQGRLKDAAQDRTIPRALLDFAEASEGFEAARQGGRRTKHQARRPP